MLNLAIRTRKVLAIVVSATVLAGAVTASTGASAKPIFWPPIHHHHRHWGFGPGALFGGLALGALAAGAGAAEYGDCGITRRLVVDQYGNEYVRGVRVCD